eukprot:13951601-Alexandrium_andersonii.AAC.1
MGGTAGEARGGAGSSRAGHSREGVRAAPIQAAYARVRQRGTWGTAGGGPRRSWELTGQAQPQGRADSAEPSR